MIELRDYSMGFGNRVLLDGVNATIGAGSLTALIGRNGSGKSTLLRNISGLLGGYGGEILLNGHDISALKPGEMARQLAVVTSGRPRIPNLRCEDLVAIGRSPYTNWMGRMQETDREAVGDALAAVGMTDYARRSVDSLSDGECQRVMIARALAQSTPVILLDEPTSFLDIPGRRELCRLLSHLSHDEGKCILFSTHELDLAMGLCDYLALIDSPQLHILTPGDMRASGHIERLFGEL